MGRGSVQVLEALVNEKPLDLDAIIRDVIDACIFSHRRQKSFTKEK